MSKASSVVASVTQQSRQRVPQSRTVFSNHNRLQSICYSDAQACQLIVLLVRQSRRVFCFSNPL